MERQRQIKLNEYLPEQVSIVESVVNENSISQITPSDYKMDPYEDEKQFDAHAFDEEFKMKVGRSALNEQNARPQANSLEVLTEHTEHETLNTLESDRIDIEDFLNAMPQSIHQNAQPYKSNRRR